ncbi:MAG: hypothetical protein ABIG61_03430 [Planctomycetota bacterium]
MRPEAQRICYDLPFLLRQKHNLYHQLYSLTEKQKQLSSDSSPETALIIAAGHRKLIEKLHHVQSRLSPILTNRCKLHNQADSYREENL